MKDDTFTTWCRQLFDSLAEDGLWGVPRSGVVFQRKGDKLVLVATMPHDPAMPITAEELAEQQEGEFESVREQFALAGIDVTKAEPNWEPPGDSTVHPHERVRFT